VARDGDGDLEAEDMVLGFEVGGYDADYVVERGFWIRGCEDWVGAQELGESGCGEGGFGGYV